MSNISSVFDRDWSGTANDETIRPLWTIGDLDNAEKVLAWVNHTYQVELQRTAKYRETALRHIALYRGRHYADPQRRRSGFAESSQNGYGIVSNKVSRLIVNYLYDAVQ